ncbi:MAG: hypothetical protein FD152_718 [Xanthobacteraceae bacterium]|nr:MAG: hypothetical protein FD152_718 [Xanthobacteraceae bacterium]
MPLTTLAGLVPATLALAATLGLPGDAPRAPAASVLYCTGCLCQEDPPVMATPGEWVPTGRMGARITLRFRPQDPSRVATSCRPQPQG